MNILVIGGMHGNEPLGIDLVGSLQKMPIEGVTGLLANQKAIKKNVRFVVSDLNRTFPGNLASTDYESKRAAFVLNACKNYDLVLDFHNTNCPDNDCSFVGESASAKLFSISSYFDLMRVIVADYDCLNKFASNCISIEVSLSSSLMDIDLWRSKIARLASRSNVPSGTVEKYSFVYRMTLEDRDNLNLPAENMKAFQPLRAGLAKKMNVPAPAYPIFIGDGYTPYNYGALLNKIK